MELLIQLAVIEGNRIPINYQYQVSAWVYQVIDKTENQSHQQHPFKMFTFGQLDMRPYLLQGDQVLLQGRNLSLRIRLGLDHSYAPVVMDEFHKSTLVLGNTSLKVKEIHTTPTPTLRTTQRYACLSPICVTRKRPDYSIEYLSPNHDDYGKHFIQYLKRKADSLVDFQSDLPISSSIHDFKIITPPRKKGVHLKNDSTKLQVIGYMFQFELTTSLEYHELGYETGFGEKNNMGFGCVEAI
jgi:CRISPR-associated endoribonuclease Cas6